MTKIAKTEEQGEVTEDKKGRVGESVKEVGRKGE